jgi:hypothetical protein
LLIIQSLSFKNGLHHSQTPPSDHHHLFPFLLNFFHFLSLMKAGFEMAQGALDTIQPHEPWDYTSVAFPAAPPFNPFLKPMMEHNELSEWVEQITKQLVEDLPETAGSDILQHSDTNPDQDQSRGL